MTTTMMISDLPEDLLREIFSRVPLKSTRAVRLTCKTWDALLKCGIIIDTAREAGESRMVAVMDSIPHLISVNVADVDHPFCEIKGKLTCLDKQVNIIKVFHCDGLLLCVLKDTFELVVWNPYLGQTWWIEPPCYSYRYGVERYLYMYALGYDNKKKCHKILRFIDALPPFDRVCYEIYDFDCNLWRTLDMGTPSWFINFYNTGVPLNGNTYWLPSHDRDSNYRDGRLICFDFTSETFGPNLPLPFHSKDNGDMHERLSSFQGHKLSLLVQFRRTYELEIWVTTMIDPNNVSWSKFFKGTTGPAADIDFSVSGFFLDEKKKVAIVFDKFCDTRHTLNIIGEAGFYTEVDVDPIIERVPMTNVHVCSYVPSLVQIKKRVEKVSQQDITKEKLEMRPCQQNKSSLDHAKRIRRT